MRKVIHSIYLLFGHAFCKICLAYWNVRDFCFPPREKAVLFVAHPDDDTLFFHTFIKEYKPYVCLCTAGWSLRRLLCFFKAMKYYGVRFRAYDMNTRDTRTNLLQKRIKHVLNLGHFEFCATHNAIGEYGHEMHVRVHNAVVNVTHLPVLVPADYEKLTGNTIDVDTFIEKQFVFKNIYTTESWVLEQYAFWVEHELIVHLK